jgi:hypothetical protein
MSVGHPLRADVREEGQDGIDAMIAGVQQQYADYRFELVAGPDAHNDRVRFTWHLVGNGDGSSIATGFDFGTLAQDGRLQSVTGFLDTPRSACWCCRSSSATACG